MPLAVLAVPFLLLQGEAKDSFGPRLDVRIEPKRLHVAYRNGFRSYELPSWRVVRQERRDLGGLDLIDRDNLFQAYVGRWPEAWVHRLDLFTNSLLHAHGRECRVFVVKGHPYALAFNALVDLTDGRRWPQRNSLQVFDTSADGRIMIRDGDRLRITDRRDLTGGASANFPAGRCLFASFLTESSSGPVLAGNADGTIWLVRKGQSARRVRRRTLAVPVLMSSNANGKVLVYFSPKTKILREPVAASVELYDLRTDSWRTPLKGSSCDAASVDKEGRRIALMTGDGKLLVKRL